MKLLFFIESLQSGGKERRLVELISGLKKYTDYEMELVLLNKEIHYKKILDTNIKIHFIKRKSKKDLIPFFSFFKICVSFKPNIIHVWGNLVAYYSLLSRIFLNIPLINNQITDAPQNVKFSLLNNTIPFYFSDLIVANSKAGLEAYKISNKKGVVIYNGFDFDRVKNLEQAEIVKKKFEIGRGKIVGMVANFTKKKDYFTFIEAAQMVLKQVSDVVFLCIGNGEYSSFKSKVNIKYSNKIRFIEAQSDIESIINVFTIGVLSTYTEGISNSVMEYMALGKPVIVTEGGGSNELINNNINGFLIPPKSPRILAEKIICLLNNDDLSVNFGRQGKNILFEKFTLNIMINEYINVYKNILSK